MTIGRGFRRKIRGALRLLRAGDFRQLERRTKEWLRIKLGGFDTSSPKFYELWRRRTVGVTSPAQLESLLDRPLVSVLTPVFDVPSELLTECVQSVLAQTYPNWEHILVDDGSRAPHIRGQLERMAMSDPRIRVAFREHNGGICAASSDALRLARGEWIALLDNDDTLAPDALLEMLSAIDNASNCEWAYSDFVLQREDGALCSPFFKPDFSPARLMNQMYLNHLQLMRRSAVVAVGGFRQGFDGSQDHDLALRMAERATDRRVSPLHVPKVLYHWRIRPGSTADDYAAKPYAMHAGASALRTALVRRGLAVATDGQDGRQSCSVPVTPGRAPGIYRVDYRARTSPTVSIVIPFRDKWSMTSRCIYSVLSRSTYRNIELVLVDNASSEPTTHAGIRRLLDARPNSVSVRDDSPFNHSALCNKGAAAATGSILLFLNNDTLVESPDWLERMLAHAEMPDVGAVGCKLLFANGDIQHGGLILGIGGVAGSAHKGGHRDSLGYWGDLVCDREVSAVTGACMMLRRSVFESVSGFDSTEFPTSYNDVDLCLRVRATKLRNIYTGHAELFHFESRTRRRDPLDSEYAARMQTRWGEALRNDPYYSPNLSLQSERVRF